MDFWLVPLPPVHAMCVLSMFIIKKSWCFECLRTVNKTSTHQFKWTSKLFTFPLIFNTSGLIFIQSKRILITGRYACSLSRSKSSRRRAACWMNSTSSSAYSSVDIPLVGVVAVWAFGLFFLICLFNRMPESESEDKSDSMIRVQGFRYD